MDVFVVKGNAVFFGFIILRTFNDSQFVKDYLFARCTAARLVTVIGLTKRDCFGESIWFG